jgi:hypothetical protein
MGKMIYFNLNGDLNRVNCAAELTLQNAGATIARALL